MKFVLSTPLDLAELNLEAAFLMGLFSPSSKWEACRSCSAPEPPNFMEPSFEVADLTGSSVGSAKWLSCRSCSAPVPRNREPKLLEKLVSDIVVGAGEKGKSRDILLDGSYPSFRNCPVILRPSLSLDLLCMFR